MTDILPVQYVLMRTDLPSMNPGKAMAQANHAASAFWFYMNVTADSGTAKEQYKQWAAETKQGFGTTIVLAVVKEEMYQLVNTATLKGLYASIVIDPTYVYKVDNEIAALIDPKIHTAPPFRRETDTVMFRREETCAWIFTPDKNDPVVIELLGALPLHP
jgi:peptidyl-tRNA hydrolase